MPNPKRKLSKSRRDKRRTHIKDTAKTIGIDQTTGEAHLLHRAHWYEGKLYYKGKVVMEKSTS
jgi:large subunit ribosomal protein L32